MGLSFCHQTHSKECFLCHKYYSVTEFLFNQSGNVKHFSTCETSILHLSNEASTHGNFKGCYEN